MFKRRPTREPGSMNPVSPLLHFPMHRTAWHITFGTHGTRLHGDPRLTVDRKHNQRGTPFLAPDPAREERERSQLATPPVLLSPEQRCLVETRIPAVCVRGGWDHIQSAAAPDHVHVLLRADSTIHGKQVRRWLKQWLTEELNREFKGARSTPWWADGGSMGGRWGVDQACERRGVLCECLEVHTQAAHGVDPRKPGPQDPARMASNYLGVRTCTTPA